MTGFNIGAQARQAPAPEPETRPASTHILGVERKMRMAFVIGLHRCGIDKTTGKESVVVTLQSGDEVVHIHDYLPCRESTQLHVLTCQISGFSLHAQQVNEYLPSIPGKAVAIETEMIDTSASLGSKDYF